MSHGQLPVFLMLAVKDELGNKKGKGGWDRELMGRTCAYLFSVNSVG
jgi:hypothetical protein